MGSLVTLGQDGVAQGLAADVSRPRQIDPEDLLVGRSRLRAHADAAVVPLQHEEVVRVHGDERGNATALGGGVHPVGELGDRGAGHGVELDDAVAEPVASTFVHHRALQHGVDKGTVRADGKPLEAAIGPPARGAVAVEIVAAVGADRLEALRDLEGADQRSVAMELVQRGAVLVGHQQVAGGRVHDETFRIEGIAQVGSVECAARSDAVQGLTQLVPELHGLDDPESGNGAGDRVNVDHEALHARAIGQHATAGSAVRQGPPFVPVGIVVDVGEVADAEPRLVGLVVQVAGQGKAVDEDRLCLARGYGCGQCDQQGHTEHQGGFHSCLHRSQGVRGAGGVSCPRRCGTLAGGSLRRRDASVTFSCQAASGTGRAVDWDWRARRRIGSIAMSTGRRVTGP